MKFGRNSEDIQQLFPWKLQTKILNPVEWSINHEWFTSLSLSLSLSKSMGKIQIGVTGLEVVMSLSLSLSLSLSMGKFKWGLQGSR